MYLIPKLLISLLDEKKKTKVVDSDVNPVWNEVALIPSRLGRSMLKHADLALIAGRLVLLTSAPSHIWCSLLSQVLEFDLKGTLLDSASCIDVVVKDYETIGKNK